MFLRLVNLCKLLVEHDMKRNQSPPEANYRVFFSLLMQCCTFPHSGKLSFSTSESVPVQSDCSWLVSCRLQEKINPLCSLKLTVCKGFLVISGWIYPTVIVWLKTTTTDGSILKPNLISDRTWEWKAFAAIRFIQYFQHYILILFCKLLYLHSYTKLKFITNMNYRSFSKN